MSTSLPSAGPGASDDAAAAAARQKIARQKYSACQKQARALRRTTMSIQTLYALECFLRRLTRTDHASRFILKGGVLLAAYDVRRPTKDADVQVLDHPLEPEHLRRTVSAVAAVQVDDGIEFLTDDITVENIREGEEDAYTGYRVKFHARLATANIVVQLDVSTGDPITPDPVPVTVPGILPGENFTILGHPLENVIAEKTVTMVQRGAASTRWRDFLDVHALAMRQSFDGGQVRAAVVATARHRGVEPAPVAVLASEFDAEAQTKYSTWRRKLEMDAAALNEMCQPVLADQVRAVARFIDPVMRDQVVSLTWDPAHRRWV